MTVDTLRRLFAYDAWGNATALSSIRLATLAPSSRACALLGHLVGAGKLWLDRIHGRPASSEVWPALTLEECESGFRELKAAWSATLDSLDAPGLARKVAYTNSKGEKWESTVADILTHVTLHGTYHRGQIALLVRGAGGVPAYTDFIEASRRGQLP
jgi:uncharacterized damage-inducible protein DinB